MAEQITISGIRPKQTVYKNNTYAFTAKSWDGNLNTYDSNSNGAGWRPSTLLLALSPIPKNAVITSVVTVLGNMYFHSM